MESEEPQRGMEEKLPWVRQYLRTLSSLGQPGLGDLHLALKYTAEEQTWTDMGPPYSRVEEQNDGVIT